MWLYLVSVIRCVKWYGDAAGNTIEENFGVFSLIRMR